MDKRLTGSLRTLERNIRSLPRIRLFVNGWRVSVPKRGGIYVIWTLRTGKAIYVGETCNLNSRLGDLGRIANHTFRRKASKIHRTHQKKALDKVMFENYLLSFKTVPFGRKEVEEYLILKWKPQHNKPQRRLLESEQYK